MMKMVKWLIKVSVAMALSLVLLSFFTLIYSHSGVHISNETGATDYKWEPNQFKSNMIEGFSWMRMNSDGFNNGFNVGDVDHIDVLIMGSSHVEAANVSPNENVGALLNNKYASEYVTYNIGTSGHTIYQCVNNIEKAISEYNPLRYVVIETDRVDLDEEKMKEVINGTLSTIPSHDTGLLYYLQKGVPCFQPIYRELEKWASMDIEKEFKQIDSVSSNLDSTEYSEVLDLFLNKVVEGAGGKKTIIIYHPETSLTDEGKLKSEDIDSTKLFQTACLEHGIIFVDMYDDFKNTYEENHVLPHGFENTAIGAGHLNKTGHDLMAKRLGEIIKELDNGT